MHSHTIYPEQPLTLSAKKLTLASGLTPLDLFTPLARQPWSIWLDSGQSNHVDACYDILAWEPLVTLCTYGNKTEIFNTQNKQAITSEGDPLSILDSAQKKTLSALKPSRQNLPFQGGALGYFSYDLGRRFENIPVQAEPDITLPEMAVGIYCQAIIFDHKSQEFYLICPQDKRSELELLIQQALKSTLEKSTAEQAFSLASSWQSNMDKASYGEKFEQVQNYLTSGDCYQINLAQRFSAQYQGDEFQAYCALRVENQAPFSAFMRLESASILSVSPERFLQCNKGKVQSKPIKGTMPRSQDEKQDKQNSVILASSLKDRAENLMIVDLLRNDISKVCIPNTVVVPKLFEIESFPAVHHLVSTVEGQLSPQHNATDLLRGAFPGGSITGAPKIRAMEIIEQLEPHRRNVYCGSIGYVSSCGTMDTSITIRTLVCDSNKENTSAKHIYCWAGGGLVADSVVSSEYQETFDKVNRILPVLEKLSKQGNSCNG